MTWYIISKRNIKLHSRMLVGIHNTKLVYWLCHCGKTLWVQTNPLICSGLIVFRCLGWFIIGLLLSLLLSKQQNKNIFTSKTLKIIRSYKKIIITRERGVKSLKSRWGLQYETSPVDEHIVLQYQTKLDFSFWKNIPKRQIFVISENL